MTVSRAALAAPVPTKPIRSRPEGGLGLGLALVEAIVAAHGGTVGLASEPGDTRVDVRPPQ